MFFKWAISIYILFMIIIQPITRRSCHKWYKKMAAFQSPTAQVNKYINCDRNAWNKLYLLFNKQNITVINFIFLCWSTLIHRISLPMTSDQWHLPAHTHTSHSHTHQRQSESHWYQVISYPCALVPCHFVPKAIPLRTQVIPFRTQSHTISYPHFVILF